MEPGRLGTASQSDAVFVPGEPTIGPHPLDVRTLIGVSQRFLVAGATVIVIEHDPDMIANADYIVDMGPGGGGLGDVSSPPKRLKRRQTAPTPSPDVA